MLLERMIHEVQKRGRSRRSIKRRVMREVVEFDVWSSFKEWKV